MLAGLFFVIGLAMLLVGADWLVRTASHAAAHLRITPLVIGLTVVAFGTSAPELAVTLRAAFTEHAADIALGNIVGSNIANILLVLGASAAIAPITVQSALLRFHVPAMIAASLLVAIMALNGHFGAVNGSLLLFALVLYLLLTLRRGDRDLVAAEPPPERPFGWVAAAGLLSGILLLGAGAYILVEAAVVLARLLGVSELVIGLTVVAVGTAAPELATSLIAALRGERQIALANIIGSNLFNLLAVLGCAALLAPGGLPVAKPALLFDIPVMVATALICLPLFWRGMRISQREGLLLLGGYAAYLVILIAAPFPFAT
ncbi:sodium:calcium antiporter [Halorhodospira abdelmalekii]|uniref:calcium/sodium antiporter n=1 Tax=Halorhodospira abdelmalekii TaxID=421629 RepID=UPI001908A181|nr:calcium/sodium antiporter [Halorhodospira abdelmalekii]MBK1734691.1 sodium:calcium antiporter [Halorhodospira abdelmalekii]